MDKPKPMAHIVATTMGEFLESNTVMPQYADGESPTIFLAQQMAVSRTGALNLARSTIPTLHQTQAQAQALAQAQYQAQHQSQYEQHASLPLHLQHQYAPPPVYSQPYETSLASSLSSSQPHPFGNGIEALQQQLTQASSSYGPQALAQTTPTALGQFPRTNPLSFDAAHASAVASGPKSKSDWVTNAVGIALLLLGLLGVFSAIPFKKIGLALDKQWGAVSQHCCDLNTLKKSLGLPQISADAKPVSDELSSTANQPAVLQSDPSLPKLAASGALSNQNPSSAPVKSSIAPVSSNTPASLALLKLCEQLIQAQPSIRFITRSSTINEASKAAIDNVLICLQNHRVTLLGHTDGQGTAERKQRVGLERADAVKAYLLELGLRPDQIYTQSAADTQPIANNDTPENRAKNRRIVIQLAALLAGN